MSTPVEKSNERRKLLALFGCFVLTGLVFPVWNILAGDVRARTSGEESEAVVSLSANEDSGDVVGVAQVVGGAQADTSAEPRNQAGSENAIENSRVSVPDRIVSFLNPQGGCVFLESYVRERLSERDLPFLHQALSDDKFAGQWSDVVFALCVLEEDRKALEVVQEFVSTPRAWQTSGYKGDAYYVIRTIMLSVRNLGWVDPALSGPLLQEIFTRPGAEKFLDDWRNVPLPDGMNFEDTLLDSVRYGAATAMLHSRSPELFKVVEDTFYKLAPLQPSQRSGNGYTMEICKMHLGMRDLYNEMGWEEGVRYLSSVDDHDLLNVTARMKSKYNKLELELSGRKKK